MISSKHEQSVRSSQVCVLSLEGKDRPAVDSVVHTQGKCRRGQVKEVRTCVERGGARINSRQLPYITSSSYMTVRRCRVIGGKRLFCSSCAFARSERSTSYPLSCMDGKLRGGNFSSVNTQFGP